jgi:hypothetical protein
MAPESEGQLGGVGALTDTVTMVQWMHWIDNSATLDAAVLLRGRTPNWYDTASRPDLPQFRSGATAGRHAVTFERRSRVVGVNATTYQLQHFNILLLDNADDPINDPILSDMIAIDADFPLMPVNAYSAEERVLKRNIAAITEFERKLHDSLVVQQFLGFAI